MLLVRAIEQSDLDGLMALALLVGDGMTTLKADPAMLRRRIAIACASFAAAIPPAERDYLFVMEEFATGALVGVCAIKAAVGLHEPFYNYRIGTLVHSSIELGIFSQMETLYLSNDLTGSAELCSLFLHPAYRTGSNGKLLSKSRFLFMAQFPELFQEKIIAEMRGFQRQDGTSPFWDSLGRHFFQMDFQRADDLSSLGKKSFIAELMPRHPLYVAYLPREAQDVIGKVHVATAPARHLLEQEGMFYDGFVDIFDAGPVLQARIADLRTTRDSLVATLGNSSSSNSEPPVVRPPAGEAPLMIATLGLDTFRAIVADSVDLSAQQLHALQACPGDTVRAIPLNRNPHV